MTVFAASQHLRTWTAHSPEKQNKPTHAEASLVANSALFLFCKEEVQEEGLLNACTSGCIRALSSADKLPQANE